eukprot:scaffold260185_cov33-Tisochrysis_lutea.AAC.6
MENDNGVQRLCRKAMFFSKYCWCYYEHHPPEIDLEEVRTTRCRQRYTPWHSPQSGLVVAVRRSESAPSLRAPYVGESGPANRDPTFLRRTSRHRS